MLLLSRRAGEKVELWLGDVCVEVTVCALEDGKIKLGFEAPQSVKIFRTELADRMRAGEKSADKNGK